MAIVAVLEKDGEAGKLGERYTSIKDGSAGMFIVMGATGHVGAAVTDELLARGEKVTILTRHPDRAGAWQDKGA